MCMSYKYENQHRGLESYTPFLNFLHNHIEKACVLNVFQSFQANPMKLSMHNSYEEEMPMTFFLWGQFQGFNKYAPFQSSYLSIRECLCLKLLPQFLSHSNETCCAWYLWRVDVHTKLDKLTSYKSKKFCCLFLFFTRCLHELWQLR